MSDYSERMEKLRSEAMNDIVISKTGFTGNIKTSSARFLCFTLPYDAGWSCYVDGKKSEILKANIGFFGVELPEGEHKVELVYSMPWLKEGTAMSVAGVVLMILIAAYDLKKAQKTHSDK